MARICLVLLILASVLGAATGESRADDASAAKPDPAAVEFFEKEVRPILATRCQECHGEKKQKGGLRLDSRASALKGGGNGPAVVPGKPGESLVVDAINYGELVQMPPKSKLPQAEIATLTKWVALGAPWPGGEIERPSSGPSSFNLRERARHWSFQTVRSPAPPAVKKDAWCRTPIDRFLFSALEAKGLSPAKDADRRTLIRRVTFDLIGLPPTPEEVEAFVADPSPKAYEKLVDRLLASPHYGERWGRHWLDLVRFAETAGHEFDYDILGAFRYRDYVIRAFNADVPYDRFVIEHIAGDLLEEPRRKPSDGSNESILGTGFFFVGEGTHSPVDVREDEVRRIDNQIDVLSKTFLGLTVACARCHDHKFDPITSKDYYALAGYLRSSRHQQAFLDAPGRVGEKVRALEALKRELSCASSAEGERVGVKRAEAQETPTLSVDGLQREILRAHTLPLADHPLSPISKLVLSKELGPQGFEAARKDAIERLRTREAAKDDSILFEDFNGSDFRDWSPAGQAFGLRPSAAGDVRVTPNGVVPVAPGFAHSGLVSERLQGVLRSKTFVIEKKFIHYRAAGRGGRINLVVDGYEKIRAPIYGDLTIAVDQADWPRWYSQDVSMWAGQNAYIEIADGAAVDFTEAQSRYVRGDGFLAVDEIRFSDGAAPPLAPSGLASEFLQDAGITSVEGLVRRIAEELEAAARQWSGGRWGNDPRSAERFALLGWLAERGLMKWPSARSELLARYHEIEAQLPDPTLAPAMCDGTAVDERVQIRGNYKTPGELVPRRFLEVLSGAETPAPTQGSGRLELARKIADRTNPLTARVMVNRIWKHHFGDGLVRSPDDFGAMGQSPSHPELLDYLATQFIECGWSIKAMHRLIVLSHAYRISSAPADLAAEQADPSNRLLHRMNVRRLEAEAIRDAILSVSGRLDRRPYGPGVMPHLTPFMEGRGRPGASGPLDGDGRRSVYLNVRRNFLGPMLLAFDFPAPATTMGRRNVSNVPAQALILLNDPFVIEEARRWAEELLADPTQSREARLNRAYVAAFGRPPTEEERADALSFLDERPRTDRREEEVRAWAEMCHVLFNVKEFIFVD